MDRREILVELLRFYQIAQEPGGNAGEWIGQGPDSKLLIRGPLYWDAPGTWDSLERCLGQLRKAKPWQAAHLEARFWRTHERRKSLRFVRAGKDRRGQEILQPLGLASNEEVRIIGPAEKSTLTRSCLVVSWPSWVMAAEVDRALLFLERTMPDPLYLPKALMEAA